MPRLILKCPYLKGSRGAARRGNYLRYIATREGVELTQGEESLPGREGYLQYIAQRPHVQRVGRHGLFSASDKPISLSKAAEELSQHPGNVWTPILSLRREDAARLGYDHWEQWQALLRAHAPEVAEAMKIPFPDFRWYAAFHNEGHHPHVHMVCYSADPSKGYLTKEGLAQMRSVLARDIFRQDLTEIYKRQTQRREDLVRESQTALRDAIQKMREGPSQSSDLEPLLLQLAEKLSAISGKKQYGYLKAPVKKLVDEIVEELAKDPAVSEAYRHWYDLREEVLHTYRDDLPERIPLSEQKEFRQIKNLVIQEAARLGDEAQTIPRLDSEDGAFQESEADAFFLPEAEPLWENDPSCIDPTPADLPWDDALPNIPKPYMEWNESYRRARCFLFGNENQHQDLDQAFQLFHAEAEKGNALAMWDLGRMLKDGLGCDPDPEASYKWYAKALASFRVVERQKPNRYAQYRIGKLYAAGLGCEQDYSEAAKWFGASADSGYMYAQYSLAGLLYRGQGVEQDYQRARELYTESAEQDFPYAAYELAKIYRDGVGCPKDGARADAWFCSAFQGFCELEQTSHDDKLQYRIGWMLLHGVGTVQKEAAAKAWFEKASRLGNPHAQFQLARMILSDPSSPGEEKKQALDWMKKSAEAENAYAQHYLGKLLFQGEIVNKDVKTAVHWLTASAEQGNQYAQYALGSLFLSGEDVPKDVEAALKWLTQSAENGNEFAQYQLGRLFLRGEEIPKDVETAARWLTASAEQGNQYAQYALGRLFLSGEDIPKDVEAALKWLTQSAEQGNEFAQYQLGRLYLIGQDVSKDREAAIHWLTLAAEQGSEYARILLERVGDWQRAAVARGVLRLFRQVAGIFQDRQPAPQSGVRFVDSKLRRKLRQKKAALGQKPGGADQQQG